MTPEAFAAWVGGVGTAIITLTRAASWLMKRVAANKAERRAETDATIGAIRTEILECRKEIEAERNRRQEAERERDIMERVLFRLGYEQTKEGRWRQNGEPKP